MIALSALCLGGKAAAEDATPSAAADAASDAAPALPELPAVNRETPTIETRTPDLLPNPTPPSSLPAFRQMPTAEQLEQLKKEKNWLVEGMKERQANKTQPNATTDDMSQSIIDMVLKKQQPGSPSAPRGPETQLPETFRSPTTPAADPGVFRPSISTSAFETLPSVSATPASTGGLSTIMARERALADQSNFTFPETSAPARDPLANPFANLPVPEGALPSAPRNRGVLGMNDPMLSGRTNPGPAAPELHANPASSATSPGLMQGSIGAPPAVRATIEQPYDYLRAQEQQRLQQQRNSNRPTVRQLRSPIPEPSEARLF
jgi:hypothetical protein